MITNNFSEREQFYHIVTRVREERDLSWREAWKLVSKTDAAVNGRKLFPTFIAFERFHLRYSRSVVAQKRESEIKTEEMHDFHSINGRAYIQELLITPGVHVNQLDGVGRSWIDIEEEQREKRIKTLLEEYEKGKRVGKDPARKRKRARTLRKGISTGDACAKPRQNTAYKNRHEGSGQNA